MAKHRIAHVDDLQPGNLASAVTAGIPLRLAHVESKHHAIAAHRTHEEELAERR
jgi:hypothetical protein